MRNVFSALLLLLTLDLSAAPTFRVALLAPADGSGDWRHLDETASWPLTLALSDALVTFDAKTGLIAAGLASSWKVEPDRLTWVFTLKPATWSDRTPLTSRDVVEAWQHSGIPAVSLEAPTSKTVRVVFQRPPDSAAVFASRPYRLYPDAVTGRCCGPFLLAGWLPSTPLILSKNANYRDSKTVLLDRLEFVFARTWREAAALYRAGRVDWVPHGGGPGTWPTKGLKDAVVSPGPGTVFLRVNLRRAATGDSLYRQGLSAALDRAALARDLRGPALVPSPFPPPVPKPGYGPLPQPKLTLVYAQGETNRLIATEIASQWKKKLELEVTVKAVALDTLADARASWDWDLVLSSWWDDSPDPTDFLGLFQTGAPENDLNWSNPEYDAAVERLRTSVPGKARDATLREAWSQLATDSAVIPLLAFGTTNQINLKTWSGWTPNPTDLHPWTGVGLKTALKTR